MTNTLTGNFKPIQLPKLNINWLSLISFLLLCSIAFVTATTIAEACEDLEVAVFFARIASQAADFAVDIAVYALISAEQTGSDALIQLALEALDLAIEIAVAAEEYLMGLEADLFDCQENKGANSGSCNSG